MRVSRERRFSGLVPMRMRIDEGLRRLHEHGLAPDLVYVDESVSYAELLEDLCLCLTLFPSATLCGTDYQLSDVRRAVEETARKFNKPVIVESMTCWTFASIDEDELSETRRELESVSAATKRRKIL